jgi:LysR family glycine cleavage system transcriptional activator
VISYHRGMNTDHGVVSDGDLRLLVSAARTGSFTAAAKEAGIGQSAVSHAIARLERVIGSRVFERRSSGVTLTDIGLRLTDEVQQGFEQIDRAVEEAGNARQQSVTLWVSTSFAMLWLMPRLALFKREHPLIEVRCHTNDTDRGVGRDEADVWVPLGRGPWPGLHEQKFCDETLIVVAAPSIARQWDGATDEQLLDAPLLHLEQRFRPRFDWNQWFEHFGVTPPKRLGGYSSSDYSLIIQAAMEGHGLAIGWLHLVQDLIAEGRLQQVGTGSVATDHPITVLTRSERTGPATAAFVEWLLATAPGRPT